MENETNKYQVTFEHKLIGRITVSLDNIEKMTGSEFSAALQPHLDAIREVIAEARLDPMITLEEAHARYHDKLKQKQKHKPNDT